ncbi:YkoP family protein [Heyndrickxia sp. NPDC080065]|uniref:YkoP family protein n=1 Tax=Heyndrickxia sp. NPDC080065 TaxID=3390568 RepID=UPI003CFFAA33
MNQLHKQKLVSEVSWKKKLMITLWIKWERLFNGILRIKTIDENHPFLNGRVRTYWGKTIQLSDGEKIQRGDRVLELHFNNERLFHMVMNSRSSVHLAIQLIRASEQLLVNIRPFILNHPKSEKIKGLFGVSMIHRGTKQLGFTVISLPKGIFAFLTKIYLRLLLLVIHPQGRQRFKTKQELLVPKVIAISTKELIRRYPSEKLSMPGQQELIHNQQE